MQALPEAADPQAKQNQAPSIRQPAWIVQPMKDTPLQLFTEYLLSL
jgi:hypothetical protein